MRVQLVDPSAFTPPYDHALAGALADAGADVELVTSHFAYGDVPAAGGYRVEEPFYRLSARLRPGSRRRAAVKLAEHVPGMVALRRRTRRADVVHYQWLAVQPLDVHLLPPRRPRVLTAHDILPREPRPGQLAATRRLLHAMDAVIAHSEHGAARLRDELGVPAHVVRVIPHGAFDYLTRLPAEQPLEPELAAVEGPVVLCFGLLRPYKGIEVLLEAFRSVTGAELWVVGMPRMPLAPLRRAAPAGVRFVPRYLREGELPPLFRRADLVVLPYLESEQSGVLATALAFAKPTIASDVGGFGEAGAVALVPPGDPEALAAAIARVLADPDERGRLAAAAAAAAAGPYSWRRAAELTLALYRELL